MIDEFNIFIFEWRYKLVCVCNTCFSHFTPYCWLNLEFWFFCQLVRFDDEDDEQSYQMFRERERREKFLRDYTEEYRCTTEYGDLILQQRSDMIHWIVEVSKLSLVKYYVGCGHFKFPIFRFLFFLFSPKLPWHLYTWFHVQLETCRSTSTVSLDDEAQKIYTTIFVVSLILIMS